MQAHPKLEAAVHLHGGTISQQNTGSRCCVLVATDMQKAYLSSVPPNTANLHITTVDHMLVSRLRDVLRTCITSCYVVCQTVVLGSFTQIECDAVELAASCIGRHVAQ